MQTLTLTSAESKEESEKYENILWTAMKSLLMLL